MICIQFKLIIHLTLNIDLGKFLLLVFPYTLFITYNEFVELDEVFFLCQVLSVTYRIARGEQLELSDKGYNQRGGLIFSRSTDEPSLERMI